MTIKEGDICREEELEKEGYRYVMHLSNGVHAYENDTQWIAYELNTGKVVTCEKRARFSYP